MSNKETALNALKQQRDALSGWLNSAREIRHFEPLVGQAYANTCWQMNCLQAVTFPAYDSPPELTKQIQRTGEFVVQNLPRINLGDSVLYNNISCSVISAGTAVFIFADEACSSATPPEEIRIKPLLEEYKSIQAQSRRFLDAKDLLLVRYPSRVSEFDETAHAVSRLKNGTWTVSEAALPARNLVQHLQGDYFETARQWPNENMTWPIMAGRLASTPAPSLEHTILLDAGKLSSRLYDRLSQILKGNKPVTVLEFENLWVEMVDHMFICLSTMSPLR
jgi:hypothetical protein